MDADAFLKAIANSPTRSGERLLILSVFVNSLPPEKMMKLKTMAVDWKTLEGELIPTFDVEFFE